MTPAEHLEQMREYPAFVLGRREGLIIRHFYDKNTGHKRDRVVCRCGNDVFYEILGLPSSLVLFQCKSCKLVNPFSLNTLSPFSFVEISS